MAIHGTDNRRVIKPINVSEFIRFPLPAVTAIDTTLVISPTNFEAGYGSGIVIAPNYVLTAAHNVYDQGSGIQDEVRVTTSANQNRLHSRIIGHPDDLGDLDVNVRIDSKMDSDIFFPTIYRSTGSVQDDIAFVKTTNNLLPSSSVVGLIAFVNPKTAQDYTIQTAGYPIDNVPNTIGSNAGIAGNSGQEKRDLVLAPGSFNEFGTIEVVADRRMEYSTNVDTFIGQSGSGVWHTLKEDGIPRVLGVHSKGGNPRNAGALITKDIYDDIMNQIEADSGTANADLLPENAIIGSDSFLSFGGNDQIFGTYRRERIIGDGGEDELFGGGADDRLEGGDGVDQALFSDIFTNYSYKINDPVNFEFVHSRGSEIDGKDTTKDIEFGVFEFADVDRNKQDDDGNLFYVPLQIDPNDNTKLKDGAIITPTQEVLDSQGEKIATMTVESPAWMFDGDVNYSLSIGLDLTEQYNIAFIIDSSTSMGGPQLADTKNALIRLIDSFVESGLDSNIDFGVIGFNQYAFPLPAANASEAKTSINALVVGDGTNFTDALGEGLSFFTSSARRNNALDIAYFISDGQPNEAGNLYNTFTSNANVLNIETDEVRAFGIGDDADMSKLDLIDSDGDAEYLPSAGNLFEAFDTSINQDAIARVDVKIVKKDGGVIEEEVIKTITPDQLVKKGFNLTYTGRFEDLVVSREAENDITFELVFNDGTPSVALDYTITTGQEEVKQQSNDGKKEVLTFSVNQKDFVDPQGTANRSFSSNLTNSTVERDIVGNDFDNTFQIQQGQNTVYGNGGNDLTTLIGGTNLVDGGEGIDTVKINQTRAESGGVFKDDENTVNIGTENAIRKVEFIEFSDVRLAVDTLAVSPIISLAKKGISVSEGDNGSTFATLSVELSSVTTENVVINVAARADFADAGIDFVQPIGQLTIAAGKKSGNLTLEVLGDLEIEGDEEIYLDLTVASGGTFANGVMSETVAVNVLDNETNLITDEDTLITIPASKLLSFYTENDFSLIGVNSPVNGTVALNQEGKILFTPAPNFNGIASFKYTVTNGTETNTELAEVIINPVNDAPIANKDSFTTNEDISITILPTELFSNDSDVDQDSLSIVDVNSSVNGTATLKQDGKIQFTPAANFNGTASFRYTLSDGSKNTTGAVDVVINPVDDELTLIKPFPDIVLTQLAPNTIIKFADYIKFNNSKSSPEYDIGLLTYSGASIDPYLLKLRKLGWAEDELVLGFPDNIEGTLEFVIKASFSEKETVTDTFSVDRINSTQNGDQLVGGNGNDYLDGKEGNDTLTGVDGNDTLIGSEGNDSIVGGNGNDTYVVNDITDVLIENVNEGTDAVASNVTYSLASNIENLTLTGTSAINGTGNTLNNSITGNTANNMLSGNAGDDSLNGDAGIDTLIGSAGNDTYFVDTVTDVITENVNGGTDTVASSVTHSLADNIENLTLTGKTAINGTGNSANNSITGNTANNLLSGGAGIDTMTGETGNDIYVVDATGDVIKETSTIATELDTVQSSSNYTLNSNVENLTLTGTTAINGTGNTLNNIINGNTANNTLSGGAANDTLSGNEGIDTLVGGAGNDTYLVDTNTDILTENASEGIDTVSSNVTYGLVSNLENLTLIGTSAINGTGNSVDNVITGNISNNMLSGGAANDTLSGNGGIDTLIGGAGNDTYMVDTITDTLTENVNEGTDTVSSSVTYTLGSGIENLTLTTAEVLIDGTGNDLNNTIIGDLFHNILRGGAGNDNLSGVGVGDTLIGGADNDTYFVDAASGLILEYANEGTDRVSSSVTYALFPNVENLILSGTNEIDGTGNNLNNAITGNGVDNTLSGGLGNDTLIGNAGNDTYIIDNASDVVNETPTIDTEIDLVQSSVAYTLGSNLEDLTLTGTKAIDGSGNSLDNVMAGNSSSNNLSGDIGNDSLTGGAGIDTLVGGVGNDTYLVDTITDTITENANEGADTVSSSVTYALGNNLENLTLAGTTGINGTGNTLNNILTGNSGRNILSGDAGIDTLIGGAGNDSYLINSITDTITENDNQGTDSVFSRVTFTLGSNLENLTLTGTSAINGTGNSLNNTISGNSANNTLSGDTGNDFLTGGAGIDQLIGGAGNDTYLVDTITDTITEDANQGTDTISSSVTYTLESNLENLTLAENSGINGTGNTLNNVLTGNSGSNILSGSNGMDTLIGGAGNDNLNGGLGNDIATGGTGNDTYVVGSTRDVVNETSVLTTEIDTVQSGISYILGTNVERLTLIGTSAINGMGNNLNNTITGNSAANLLSGGAGNDTMTGGLDNDTYVVDTAEDIVSETSTLATEIDTVQSDITYSLGANVENLTLDGTSAINGTGNSLNNAMTGNSAANAINGSVGNDTMTGGAGNDTYVVGSTGDVVNETSVLTTEIDTVQSGISYILGTNVERLTLIGTSAINGTGNNLNNTIMGNSANNTLFGGIGNDTLTAGLGSDRFTYDTNAAFTSSAIGVDQITDFVSGTDKIVLDKTTFTALTSIAGNGFNLASEFAVVGSDAAASTASALIVYSSETDNLFYNQNGVTSGFGSGAQLATLTGIPALSADDFVLQA